MRDVDVDADQQEQEPLWGEGAGRAAPRSRVRIEDMVLVTEAAPRILSRVEYEDRLLS